MNEILFNLLMTITSAVATALAAFIISFIKKKGEQLTAQTDSIKQQGYIAEIADAISNAVAATSQTYVDSLKASGSFDLEAQKTALQMSLTAAINAISPAAKAFIEAVYGNLNDYLTNRIEAEVRSQKAAAITALPAALDGISADATAVAASTAAATAAAVMQNTIAQTSAK